MKWNQTNVKFSKYYLMGTKFGKILLFCNNLHVLSGLRDKFILKYYTWLDWYSAFFSLHSFICILWLKSQPEFHKKNLIDYKVNFLFLPKHGSGPRGENIIHIILAICSNFL